MTHRCKTRIAARAPEGGSLALVLLASLFVTQIALAQDPAAAEPAPASSTTDIENEMPPGDPPKAAAVVVDEGPEPGTIKDASDKRRPYGVSLMAHVPWLDGIGIGFKAAGEIPIMHNGFIPSLNDSFSIEPCFLMAYQRWYSFALYDDLYVLSFTPAVSAIWSFYFKSNLRAYAQVSLGWTFVQKANYNDVTLYGVNGRFYHEVAVGGYWDFATHWALRAEIGYAGFRAGIAFLI